MFIIQHHSHFQSTFLPSFLLPFLYSISFFFLLEISNIILITKEHSSFPFRLSSMLPFNQNHPCVSYIFLLFLFCFFFLFFFMFFLFCFFLFFCAISNIIPTFLPSYLPSFLFSFSCSYQFLLTISNIILISKAHSFLSISSYFPSYIAFLLSFLRFSVSLPHSKIRPFLF